MRIGEFSKKTSTSIDTIRHYITLGLLVPPKEGKYFRFDDRCTIDLEGIKEMKEMDFTLQEIKNIFLLSRFSKLSMGQEKQHYRSFFKNKMKKLTKERELLDEKIALLEKKVNKLDVEFKQEPVMLGIDLTFLPNIYCPDYQKSLKLDSADIQENMIINGHMSCDCGYHIEIIDGILVDRETMKITQETDDSYVIRYVDETDSHFLDNLYAAMEWSYRTIKPEGHQLMLELGVGNGIFLSHFYNHLPDNMPYVAVDYDYNKLKYLKKVFERSGIKKKIVFMCADYICMPLKHQSVDYIVDFFGMSNYSFRNHGVLHEQINQYYKESCKLLGTYMLFDKYKSNEELSQDQYRLFKKKDIQGFLKSLGFNMKHEYETSYAEEGEKDDEYLRVTNRVSFYGFLGER